ncbi:hypothetical protein CAC42_6599 [Sphaceloma murrayae]|uniref:SAP domain-containing protein n=1 Tax=Sphaceloma murrayae TaxID=2082308 RepID=A0A2K1QFX6_9PEZI|nr:hypothetical protein CAC42_6599 [Sphaceloma murrayae]
MSAPRISQFIPLRQLATTAARQCPRQRRNLHMTGPSTFPSKVLVADRPTSNLPSDLAGLRAEAQRRNLDTTGSKGELTSRLQASDILSHCSFHTSQRPTPSSSKPDTGRQFNTSRTLKANNDSSTIDFAYLPDLLSSTASGESSELHRVPIIRADSARGFTEDDAKPVMRPVINSSSLDAVVSPMSEVTDNSAVDIDFEKVVGTVGSLAGGFVEGVEVVKEKVEKTVEAKDGEVRRVWSGFLDDVLGKKIVA